MTDLLKPYTLVACLIGLLLLVAAFLAYGNSQYTKGQAVAKAEAVIQVAKERAEERERQLQANALAHTEALKDIAQLSLANENLQQKLKENKDAATQDPTALRECLGPDSVRRLNAIR